MFTATVPPASARPSGWHVGYLLSTAALVLYGEFAGAPEFVLAAVVLTLPAGIAAFVGIYGGYAVVQAVGGLFASPLATDGSERPWLAVTTGVVELALFLVAAEVNVRLLRHGKQYETKRTFTLGR